MKNFIFISLCFLSLNLNAQTLDEILDGEEGLSDLEEEALLETTKEPSENIQPPTNTQNLVNIRAKSRMSFGLMPGLTYGFMNIKCVNFRSNNSICDIGRASGEGGGWDPMGTPREPEELNMRGLGYLLNGFFNYSINSFMSLRATLGYDVFTVKDTTKESELLPELPQNQNGQQLKVQLNCGQVPTGPQTIVTQPRSLQPPSDWRCYANIGYVSLGASLIFTFDLYEDISPWLGLGAKVMVPVMPTDSNALGGLTVRSGFDFSLGTKIKLMNSKLFFPISINFTYLYSEPQADVRDYYLSAGAGIGMSL